MTCWHILMYAYTQPKQAEVESFGTHSTPTPHQIVRNRTEASNTEKCLAHGRLAHQIAMVCLGGVRITRVRIQLTDCSRLD